MTFRHKDSGEWFLQSAAYQSWNETSSSFLWLYGKPGCGKTVLSSTIIEHQHKLISSSHVLLYFYFDFSDTAKHSFEQMICSLVYQLYCHAPGVQRCVDSLWWASQNGASRPSIVALCATFLNMLEVAGQTRIILDALDECTTRKELVLWIQNMCTSMEHVHILTTSRPEQDISSSFNAWVNDSDTVPLQSDLVSSDIAQYVQDRVRNHQALSRWQGQPHVQNEIEQALIEKADGMYEIRL